MDLRVAELEIGVLDQLDELYPGDMATGFAAGDLRGAFVVRPASTGPQ